VIEGPDVGTRFVIRDSDPLPALVGSSPVCAIRLRDLEVSRRHATLDIHRRALHLKDVGSTNGTSVDGVLVIEALLRPQQTIRLGQTALKVGRVEVAPVAEVARSGFGRLAGESAEMRRLYPVFAKVAASDLPVILEGETGTGKELLAEVLHEEGPRAAAPFVVFDCAGLPPSEFDEELFGRAGEDRRGVLERASGGTLFFDRIDQLDVNLQPRLLRVIERGEVTPIGGRPIKVDVRIIAASVRDLDQEIQLGRMREDLYHRIAAVRIELPPLRRRRGDVALLADRFHRELGGDTPIAPRVLSAWEDHSWPGNVRELRHAVARRLALGDEDRRESGTVANALHRVEEELHDVVKASVSDRVPLARARQQLVELYERMYVRAVLEHHGGHIARAAAAAGIGRRYFEMLRARRK
jgi:two-component system, NtrC family, response regulator HydG